MTINRLGIVGAGTTGGLLARVAAENGISSLLIDASKENLEKAVGGIRMRVERQVVEEKITNEEKDTLMRRIQLSLDLKAVNKADFIVETITDQEKLKLDLIRELDRIVPASVVLASNTSAISVTKLARTTSRPKSVVGLHFVPPVSEFQTVEVIRGLQTSEETLRVAGGLVETLKFKWLVSLDYPGFVFNRILYSMINEATYSLYEGMATAEQIDRVFKGGPLGEKGPLSWADAIGLDKVLLGLQSLYQETGNPKFQPCPLLVKYVEAGYSGQKAGKGFFQYS